MKLIKPIAIVSAIFITGCAVGPDYKEPQVQQVPAQYGQTPTTQASTQPATTQPIAKAWWTSFNDEMLNRLVAEARQANLDLRTAEARVREARAARGIVSADYWPDIDAVGSYSRSQSSKT